MWTFLKNLFKSEPVVETPPNKTGGVLVSETDEGKLFTQIATNGCPDCGTRDFSEGPSGGMMTNIECRNGHRFNISAMLGIAHRI